MPDTSKAVNVKLADGTTVKIEYLKDVISTTHIAREYAKAGYPDKYIVISETQRSTHLTGRKLKEGEFERGVFISCVLRPAFFPTQAGLIGHTTAVALAEALKNGDIAGAGIDVFEMEPPVPVDHPLFGAPNLIATPHVAFATAQSMVKRAVIVMDNIDAFLNEKPINLVK